MALVPLDITVEETEKLLQLIGHDPSVAEQVDVVNLVKALYRTLTAFDCKCPPASLDISLNLDQLLAIHRQFTPAAFGVGGREFHAKLGRAFVAYERLEMIPEIETEATVDGQEFGRTEQLGLAQWRDLEE